MVNTLINYRIVHPKMKIIPLFTQTQAILDVYEILLSDKYNQSYIKTCPGSSELYNVESDSNEN